MHASYVRSHGDDEPLAPPEPFTRKDIIIGVAILAVVILLLGGFLTLIFAVKPTSSSMKNNNGSESFSSSQRFIAERA